MLQQLQIDLQQPRPNILDCEKIKKALIVVGKMGHGKSSFVNTLIRPKSGEQPNWVKEFLVEQKANLANVTQSCAIRKVNLQHGLIPDLWVIDTPGLDSHSSPCLISQQIDNIIIDQKCDVIGIAYVININNRESGVNGNSVLKQFLRVLKIKKQLKNNLIFFILSKWDALYCLQQTQNIQNLKLQFKKFISQIGIKQTQDKLIQWVSYKQSKTKIYNSYIKQYNGQQKINNQWLKLKQIFLKISTQPLRSLAFQQHLENINNFWQKLRQRIFTQIKDNNITYNQNQTKIDYNLGILLHDWDILQQQKYVMQVMMKIPLINLIALLYSIKTWFIKKQTKVIQTTNNNLSSSKLKFQIMQQKQLQQQIQTKLKSVIMLGIVKNIKLTKNKIVFDQIGKKIKISKILTGYKSQFCQNLKVPVAYIYENQINSKIEIDCFFQNGNQKQQQVLLHQQKIVQMFKNQSYEPDSSVRIPKEIKIYVQQKQQKINLIIKAYCKLPKQQCYVSLIKSQCLEMFGKYD